MIIAKFDVPFYAWPTTGAVIAGIFAIFVSWWTLKQQTLLKIKDNCVQLRNKIDSFTNVLSSICSPHPDFGESIKNPLDELWLKYKELMGIIAILKLYKNLYPLIENLEDITKEIYEKTAHHLIKYQHYKKYPTKKNEKYCTNAIDYLISVTNNDRERSSEIDKIYLIWDMITNALSH